MARLQRTLSLGSVVLFGIAYMTPIIVLGTFGILAQSTAGMVPAAYLAALVAMFFTAMSYGRMAEAERNECSSSISAKVLLTAANLV